MPDLDDILNAASGRQLADRAGRAAAGGAGIDELTRRGVRRGQRLRAAAVAGVAAATAAAVGIGVGLSGGLSADAPPPVDVPSDDASPDGDRRALEDLTPEEIAASRFAGPVEVVLGDEPDSRFVWWTASQRGTCRAVGAVTDDDGDNWSWTDLPGSNRGCRSGTTVVALPEGGGWALSRYLSPDVLVVGLDGAVSSVRPDPATPLPMNAAQVLVPVGPDVVPTIVTADGSARTAGWEQAPEGPSADYRDPVGRIVAPTTGRSFQPEGSAFCCVVGAAIRWSVDGGRDFSTYELASVSDAEGAVNADFGLSAIVESYAEDTLAVIEGGETNRGPGTGGTVTYGGIHRTTDDGTSWERFAIMPGNGPVDVSWELVAPDGTLLVWERGRGLVATDGDDWSALDPLAVELPDGPAEGAGAGLEDLVDHREVDGELQLLVRTGMGDFLVSSDTGRTWTATDPLP